MDKHKKRQLLLEAWDLGYFDVQYKWTNAQIENRLRGGGPATGVPTTIQEKMHLLLREGLPLKTVLAKSKLEVQVPMQIDNVTPSTVPATATPVLATPATPATPGTPATPAPLTPATRPTSTSASSQNKSKSILNCPPSEADARSFMFQHALVTCSDKFPSNDKMDQTHVGLRQATLDCILEKISRGPAETKRCFAEVSTESQDRIHMGSLFPGFRYVIPCDRDMIAEVKGVTYYVVARDENGEPILDENGKPVLVPKVVSPVRTDMREYHEFEYKNEAKWWRCDFTTKVKNSALSEWLKKEYPYVYRDFWQPASIIEAKWNFTDEDIFQSGSSGCNELLRELKLFHPVDRLYTFVWTNDVYNYGILDIFGYLTVCDNKITPESFANYELHVAGMRDRLKENFPEDSYRMVPGTLKEMQALYDMRKAEYERLSNTKLNRKVCDMLVGIYYVKPNMKKKLVTGNLGTELKDAYNFVQGFMRIHIGNEFLGWTPEMVEGIYRQRVIEIRKEQRHFFKADTFQRNLVLYDSELKATKWTDNEVWSLKESEHKYVIRLELPNFAGRVDAVSGPIDVGLQATCLDMLKIFSNEEPVENECCLSIVFLFSSVDTKECFWEYVDKQVIITIPKKRPPQLEIVRVRKRQRSD